VVAFFTGMASFIYEIGWIRMLSLVLGASTHSFELMLAAFIFGLALGGLAALFAAVFTVGPLARNSELTAAKAGGVSFHRLATGQ